MARTTITIDEQLLSELKRKAAATGSTVSRLIEESVRLAFQQRAPETQAPFRLVTYGQGGEFSEFNMDKAWKLLEKDDIREHGRTH